MLEREVLEYGLDDEIRRTQAAIVCRPADQSQIVVELMARDLALGEPFLHDGAQRGQSSPYARRVRVLEANWLFLLHGDGRDAGAHEPRAEHGDPLDRARARWRAVDARILFECVGREEKKNELTGHVAHRHVAEQLRFPAQSGLESFRVPRLHGLQRGERRRILSVGFLHHTLARLLEDDAAAEWIVLEEEARRAERARTRRLEGAVGESAGALHGDIA